MARIRKTVKAELTREEKETLLKASQILDELAHDIDAEELYENVDNREENFNYLSRALILLIGNSK